MYLLVQDSNWILPATGSGLVLITRLQTRPGSQTMTFGVVIQGPRYGISQDF